MTARPPSRAKLAANRANARKSTGPKSPAGKTRVAANALRHGLAISIATLSGYEEPARQLAALIAGADASDELIALARPIAEAQLDLRRIRAARLALLEQAVKDPDFPPEKVSRQLLALRLRLAEAIMRLPDNMVIKSLAKVCAPRQWTPPERMAAAITGDLRQLASLDRYERRASSRRKAAIRAFDAARLKQAPARTQ